MTGNAVDGILMLLGLIAVVTIVLLAFGKLFLIGLDAIITKWRRLGIVPRVVAVLMAAVATVEAQKGGAGSEGVRSDGVDSHTHPLPHSPNHPLPHPPTYPIPHSPTI